MRADRVAQPAFSVVVPTFQRRDVVCDAVRAIGAIRYDGSVEVVVVVDGSTDGTADALRTIGIPYPLEVIEQENRGAASARNRGARAAQGEIVLFLDDDMMCAPDILEQHALTYGQGADAVLGDIPLDPASPPGILAEGVGLWAAKRGAELASGEPLALHDLLTGHLSIRKAVFEELGGFDEDFTAGGSFGNEDLDLGVRLLERHDVRFNPRAVSRQRYVVTPAQYLRQWRQAGAADARLAWKHPDRARALFAPHFGQGRAKYRLLRGIGGMPRVASLVERLAIRLAEDKSRHRGLRAWLTAKVIHVARESAYWRGVGDVAGHSVSVLCYHAVADLSHDAVLAEYGIPRERFAAQLDALLDRGCRFVSGEQLLAFLEAGVPLPPGAVLLTFDDCYAGIAEVASDVLQPRGIPAVAFAVASRIGDTNAWDQPLGAATLPLADAKELARLAALGVEIGCHSDTHRQFARLPAAALAAETAGAADRIEASGLGRPRFFAYPYGVLDRRAKAAVRSAGFRAGFGLVRGPVTPRSDRAALPRLEVLASSSLDDVLRMAGAR